MIRSCSSSSSVSWEKSVLAAIWMGHREASVFGVHDVAVAEQVLGKENGGGDIAAGQPA